MTEVFEIKEPRYNLRSEASHFKQGCLFLVLSEKTSNLPIMVGANHYLCESFEAFDCNPPLEVRSIFLDISKAFDKVWHKGLLYKLKSVGISGDLFNLLENYLSGRLQRVVLNGQTSSWRPVLAGVRQGSILGPLLFLVYINDLPNGLKSNAKLFADDTSLFTIVKDKQESADVLNKDLSLISKWAFNWKMLFNPHTNKPAQEVLFSRKKKTQNHPNISLNNIQVERVSHQKH